MDENEEIEDEDEEIEDKVLEMEDSKRKVHISITLLHSLNKANNSLDSQASVVYCPRASNSYADNLAKKGYAGCEDVLCWSE
ncbi:hypothetical protein Ddye_013393 [Dipteronia dyeriana]|uniref:Uncharacterized protein n=1 Tax=Dipteronia dyeriana TaxID=168575 RepID=A0AAD9X6C6_9ROSI|nr:hypothetical protein Ddye_013393 [Dipteronia dyeriana]